MLRISKSIVNAKLISYIFVTDPKLFQYSANGRANGALFISSKDLVRTVYTKVCLPDNCRPNHCDANVSILMYLVSNDVRYI